MGHMAGNPRFPQIEQGHTSVRDKGNIRQRSIKKGYTQNSLFVLDNLTMTIDTGEYMLYHLHTQQTETCNDNR